MTKSGKRVAKKRPARRKKWTTPSAEMKEQQNLLPPSPPSAASSPSSSFLPEVEGVEEGGGGEDPVIRMMNPPEISPLCTPNTEAMEKEDEDLHCLILSCSICTTEFPANEEPKVRFPGSSDEDWKDLVFRALCMHLNIQDFYEKIVSTENGINAAMMAFHMCQECLLYGWRLVELDQYLSTLKTEINSLADSFRTIISTFMSPTENDDHNGEVEVGLVFMRNFKTLATQSAPLIGTVEESNVMDDLNLNYTLDDVVDGILNEPTFANTEELQEEPVNDKDELSLNESSISNGNDTQEEELLFMNGTEGTEGHFNDDDNEDEFDRILSPSPPYSPLSPLFMEDTSVTIHDSLNMNGEDSSLGHNDFIQEEEGEGNTRSTCDVDDLFVDKMCENASPSFYPTMEDLPTPVVQPCSRRVDRNRKTRLSPKPKREPLKKIKSKRISKVGKQKKDKVTLSKRNSTPRRCAVHKNNKTKKIVNSSGAPRRLRISKKVIASLPSKDVEAYKILTRLGIPFQLVQVKVENLSLQNVLNNGIITMEDESPGGKSKHVVRVNSVYYDELFDIKIDQRIRTSPTRHSPRSTCKKATKPKSRALLDPNSSIVPIVNENEMVKELSISPISTTREQEIKFGDSHREINHTRYISPQNNDDFRSIQIHSPVLQLQNGSNGDVSSTCNNLPPLLQPVDPFNDKGDISSSSENDLTCQAPCLAPYFITADNSNDANRHQLG